MGSLVQEYWENRAREDGQSHTATTNDVYLRELEIQTCIDTLGGAGLTPASSVLDVGCGDGYSTMAMARAFPSVRFGGIDYSRNMIELARKTLGNAEAKTAPIDFQVADVTRLEREFTNGRFDAVVSMRCLINLESAEQQAMAFSQIAAALKPGGMLIAFENFMEGQEEMNRARERMGLPPIPIRWHNRYFREDEFRDLAEPHFQEIEFSDFASGYYYATRVLYSALCQAKNERPDYHHDIHRLAVKLPPTGRYSPVRLVTAIRRGAS